MLVGYFDEIKNQRIKEHLNEVGGSNLLVYPTVTCKLRHVTTTERGFVNPYQKQKTQHMIMWLIEMSSNEGDWILDLLLNLCKFNICSSHAFLVSCPSISLIQTFHYYFRSGAFLIIVYCDTYFLGFCSLSQVNYYNFACYAFIN